MHFDLVTSMFHMHFDLAASMELVEYINYSKKRRIQKCGANYRGSAY